MRPIPHNGRTHVAAERGAKLAFAFLMLVFPLSRAEHRRGGRKKTRGLSETHRSLGKGGASFGAPGHSRDAQANPQGS